MARRSLTGHSHEPSEHNHPISIEAQMRLAMATIEGLSTAVD